MSEQTNPRSTQEMVEQFRTMLRLQMSRADEEKAQAHAELTAAQRAREEAEQKLEQCSTELQALQQKP